MAASFHPASSLQSQRAPGNNGVPYLWRSYAKLVWSSSSMADAIDTILQWYTAMDQYLLIPFLGGWTSIYQLFWCSPGVQGFDTLPYIKQTNKSNSSFPMSGQKTAMNGTTALGRPRPSHESPPGRGKAAGTDLSMPSERFKTNEPRACTVYTRPGKLT